MNYLKLPLTFWIITAIYVASLYIQAHLLINSDTTWLIEASRRMVEGGSYARDYFEINPPFILYVYIPIVLAGKLFSLPVFIALPLFVYILATISMVACWWLMRGIIARKDSDISGFLLMVISAVFLILPLNEFGQREHIMTILTLPYFFLVAYRLYGNRISSVFLPVVIGVMAGVGFAIKPYFVPTFLMIEGYYFYRKFNGGLHGHCDADGTRGLRIKRVWYRALLRVEVVCVLSVMACYLLLILIRHQDYLTVVIPVITKYFYQNDSMPIKRVLFDNGAFYFYFTVLLYVIRGRQYAYSTFSTVLMVAAVGFFFSNAAQRVELYYHILPAFSLEIILISLLYSVFVTSDKYSRSEISNMVCYTLLLFMFILYRLNFIWISITYYPLAYFAFFGSLYSFLLYLAYGKKRLPLVMLLATALIGFNYFFYTFLHFTIWQNYLFPLTTLMLFLMYILFIPNTTSNTKFKFTCFSVAGAMLFAFPFYLSAYIYTSHIYLKDQYMGLVNIIKNYPGKSIYFFTDSCYLAYPALTLTDNKLAARYACVTGLPQVSQINKHFGYKEMYARNKQRVDFFINATNEDFISRKPDLVFVDLRAPSKDKKLQYFGNIQIDYLQLFQQDPVFKKLWENYRYIKTVDGQPLYKFQIYARVI